MTGLVSTPVGAGAKRPDPVEWPGGKNALAAVADGTPLLVRGQLVAALKDASWLPIGPHLADPRVRSKRYVLHVVVAREGAPSAACGMPDGLDDLYPEAAGIRCRCRRSGCARLFVRADRDAARTVGR